MRSQTRPVCNKGITQFLPATHTRTIVSVLPSRKAIALSPVPSCTAWWQRHIFVRNLPRVFTPWCPAKTRTCDLLIASPTPYRNTTTPPSGRYRIKEPLDFRNDRPNVWVLSVNRENAMSDFSSLVASGSFGQSWNIETVIVIIIISCLFVQEKWQYIMVS